MEPCEALSRGQEVSAAGVPAQGAGAAFLLRVTRVLGSRHGPLVLTLLAVIVSLPALGRGPFMDDLAHRASLIGPTPFLERLARVGLAPEGSGQLAHVLRRQYVIAHPGLNLERLRDYGTLPWWTYEGFRIAFWRPAAGLTYWLDYRLFPDSFGLMHLHSILWFAAAMLAVTVLYRQIAGLRISGTAPGNRPPASPEWSDCGLRIEPGLTNPPSARGPQREMMRWGAPIRHPQWIAGLAALMYLLDDGSYFPTMWVANRNLLIALVFAIVTLIAYDRGRRGQWKGGGVVAALCLLVSLLAAEAGLATFAYLFAYEHTLGQGRRLRRALALAPSIAVIGFWRLLYNLQGYGADSGGFYLDPAREPWGYALAALQRLPLLLGGQWTTVPAEAHSFAPPWIQARLCLFLAVVTVLVPVALLPLLRTNRRARFWLIGMYGSALPFCATIPMSRALLFAALGAFGVLAEFTGDWLGQEEWVPVTAWRRRAGRTLLVALLVAHVPLAAAARLAAPRLAALMQAEIAETMNLDHLDVTEDQDLIVVNAPNPASFLYDPFARAHDGRTLPRGLRMLVPGFGPVEVLRTGPRRLVVRSVFDSLFDCERGKRMDFVFFYRHLSDVRGPTRPLHAGQRILLPRLQAEVLAVEERGFPVAVAFEFDVPLEDSSLRWVQWDWDFDLYRPFPLPAVGEAGYLAGPF